MQLAAPIARPVRRLLLTGTPGLRPVLLGVLVVAVLAGAGVVAYQRLFAPAAAAPAGQIVAVQRSNLAATVSATGSVVATRQAKLVFSNSGHIKDILVNVGDAVTAGQPLARLVSDTNQVKLDQAKLTASLPPDVIQAQSALAGAESKLHTAHTTLDQLAAQLVQANADLAGQQSALTASIKAADQTCGKLGGSSGECAVARSANGAKQASILKPSSR